MIEQLIKKWQKQFDVLLNAPGVDTMKIASCSVLMQCCKDLKQAYEAQVREIEDLIDPEYCDDYEHGVSMGLDTALKIVKGEV